MILCHKATLHITHSLLPTKQYNGTGDHFPVQKLILQCILNKSGQNVWDGGTHLLYLSAHTVLERDFFFFQHCPFSSTISCFLHCWMYLTSELIGDTMCCSVLTCDLVICSNRRRSSVNSTPMSDAIYMLHIIWIHYSYNQLANHLLRKHHLGSGYFYFAHLDALFLFTSSWAESGNNNNAQRVIVDVHIKSANKITAMTQNPIWYRVKHWKPVQSNQGVERWKHSCPYLVNVPLLLKS